MTSDSHRIQTALRKKLLQSAPEMRCLRQLTDNCWLISKGSKGGKTVGEVLPIMRVLRFGV